MEIPVYQDPKGKKAMLDLPERLDLWDRSGLLDLKVLKECKELPGIEVFQAKKEKRVKSVSPVLKEFKVFLAIPVKKV